ncbi:MAG: VOC family protein [Chloroflexi bacterium]|nr:VOC family protein [Chloroflexota bacterium]
MPAIEQIDHFAMDVTDIDARVAFFTEKLGMTVRRWGTHFASGKRIVMLADPRSGFKIELIEAPDREEKLTHVAFRVSDVETAHQELVDQGLASIRGPHHLDAAKADTALLKDASGFNVQIVKYEPDSPDL